MDSKDISVVVQGPVDGKGTQKCLRSIRKYIPGANIVLSTWKGSELNGFDYDKLVENEDPGSNVCSIERKEVNNLSRQIVSTYGGLKYVNTKYTLKIRSDLIFYNSKILKIKFENLKKNNKYCVFKERILVPSIYSKLYLSENNQITPMLFHPSDWLFFGLSDDLKYLFNIELPKEPEFSLYYKHNLKNSRFVDPYDYNLFQYTPEQYIFYNAVKKKIAVKFDHRTDINSRNVHISRLCMLNNFYIANLGQLGIMNFKYDIKEHSLSDIDYSGLYTNERWEKEYKKYLDKNYKPRFSFRFINRCRYLSFVAIRKILKRFPVLYAIAKKIYWLFRFRRKQAQFNKTTNKKV